MERSDDWRDGFLAGFREGEQAGIEQGKELAAQERKARKVTVRFAPMSPVDRDALTAVVRRAEVLTRIGRRN